METHPWNISAKRNKPKKEKKIIYLNKIYLLLMVRNRDNITMKAKNKMKTRVKRRPSPFYEKEGWNCTIKIQKARCLLVVENHPKPAMNPSF